MAVAKFSNFTINYLLGERKDPDAHADHAAASQNFQEDLADVIRPSVSGFNTQTSGLAVMGFLAPCTNAACFNTFHCCGPVTYDQTNFNMGCLGGQHWYHSQQDYGKNGAQQCPQHNQRARTRTVFTESQVKQLDQLFNITNYPSAEARAQLARSIDLSEETVRVWFKNRRARRKKQTSM